MASKLPTERQVLRCIFDMYEKSYPGEGENKHDPLVPIDIPALANRLHCSPELLFGYLNSFLEQKYRRKTGDNSYITLFSPVASQLRHVVNFPYLAAILAERDQEHSKYWWSLGVSLVALAISIGSASAPLIARLQGAG